MQTWAKILRIITVFSIAIVASVASASDFPRSEPEAQGISSERLARVSEMANQYVAEGRVPGMVNLILRNGEVVHFEATGRRGADDDSALKPDDLFRIYSMTKPITSVAALQLYERGKFQMSDPVEKFVPELKDLQVLNADGNLEPAQRKMTMQDLLTHTAGFSYGFNAQTDVIDQRYLATDLIAAKDLDEFAAKLGKLPLKFHPGERWHYSVAVDVTGLVVERLSGQTLNEYFEQHIFEPLGMSDTFFEVPEAKRDRFLPNHYFDWQTRTLVDVTKAPPPFQYRENVAMSDFFNVSLYSGGGGLVSTAMDYARFAEMLRRGGSLDGKRILGPKTVAYMTRNHVTAQAMEPFFGNTPTPAVGSLGVGFGLGVAVITDSAAAGVMGSDGEYNWGGAAGTVFWIDPVEEIVAISMIQLMGSPWPLREDLKVGIYQALSEIYADQ